MATTIVCNKAVLPSPCIFLQLTLSDFPSSSFLCRQMGVGHGRTSALNDPLTDSSQIPDGHSPCMHQRLAGASCRNSRMTTHQRGGSGAGGTVCCGLRRCLLTWAAVMMLIPGTVEAFAIPLDFFLPLQRTVQRVRASYYRPEVYKTDDRPPRKPSLMR